MMIWTAKFSRKRAVLAVLAMGVVMAVLILLTGREAPEEETASQPQLTDDAQRAAYLQGLGWEVSPEPLETLQFLLPEELEEPYLSYNEMQTPQGFDLASCCGEQVTRYTYAVTNYPGRPEGVQANLYLCRDVPVAGDIFCPGAEGFQKPLIPGPEKDGEA